MSFTFKKAIRENVGLIIGIAGGTGAGKTFSALRLASGIAGGKPFAVIDTEAGRAKHYADQFNFDHGDLHAPFNPLSYLEAIQAADKAGYPVIVVDSMSHEYAGIGGVLEMQEAEFKRLGERDSCKMASWIKPKMEHKKMVNALLQIRAHLILCFRADEKVEITKDEKGKTVIVAKQGLTGKDGWFPITEKNLPYETTVYFLLLASQPGIPHPIKLQEQHRSIFIPGQPIDETCGARLNEWASSTTPQTAIQPQSLVTPIQIQNFLKRVAEIGFNEESANTEAFTMFDVISLDQLTPDQMKEVGKTLRQKHEQAPSEPTAEELSKVNAREKAESE
jgi:hypothetical protein